jgi:hypothetical protein
MASDSIQATPTTGPVAVAHPKPAPKPEAPKQPSMKGDQLSVRRPAPKAPEAEAKASVEVPGEDVRNSVSLTGTVLGPVVTAKQSVGMLASATFKNPLLAKLSNVAGKTAGFASKFKFLTNPAVTGGLKVVSRALPFLGLGLLSFDGYATVKTFMTPEASGTRKALTAGRFLFNAISTGVSFIPGAGFVYSLLPGLVGNGFEIAMAKLNAKEAAK